MQTSSISKGFGSFAVAAGIFLAAPLLPVRAETTGNTEHQNEIPPYEDTLRELGKTLSDAVESTQSDPSISEIMDELQANIDTIGRLRGEIGDADVLTDDLADAISADVSAVAESYRRIASLAPGVFERRLQQMESIEDVADMTGFQLADANHRVEVLRTDNDNIRSRLQTETLTSAEIAKLKVSMQANDAEISSLNVAISAWHAFSAQHKEITEGLGGQSETLDLFFHTLKENARVYDSAARTLNITKSLRAALRDLGRVEDIESLRSDLVESWGELMTIVDEVRKGLNLGAPGT